MQNRWIFALLGIVLSTLCFGCGTTGGYSTLVPSIKQVSPQTIAAGTPGLTMTVKGSGFTQSSAVLWNAAALPTQVIDANTLAAPVASTQVAAPATVQLRVMDTSTGDESASTPVQVVGADTKATVLAIAAPTLGAGQVGTVYTAILQASGGTPNYTWTVQAGNLPAGLSLAPSTGVISGTPTASGTFAFTVQVSDSGATAQTKTASASITVNPSPLTIGSAAVASGQVGTLYSATLQATGGSPAYAWSIESGSLPAGLTLGTSTGVLSGTPSSAGTFNFTAQVTDAGSPAQTQTAAFTLTISPSTLSIAAVTLGAAQVGSAYSGTLQGTGGTPAYTWTVTSGALPSGLTLASATGAISGVPTAAGTFPFSVQLSDAGTPAQTQTTTASITVNPSALTITPITLGAGQIGTAYSGALLATGGTPSYAWSLKSGSLPAGLTLSSNGILSGTPTASGTFNFTVQLADSASPAQTQIASGSITIAASTFAITPISLGAGQVGTAFSGSLQATGGTPAYTWFLKSGSLPGGLTLSSGGTIAGTPTAAGTFSFSVQATDSSSPAQTQTASGSITVAPSALAIASISLGSAQIGVAYSGTLQANGGTPGYLWTIKSGTLPAGLTLSPAGAVSGTPTAAGTFSFTVQVSDSGSPAQAQSTAASITVGASSLVITVAALPAGQNGAAYSATLSATGGTPGYIWAVKSGALPAGLSLSAAGILSGTPTATGSFTFAVQVTDNGSPAQTQTATTTVVINPSTLAIGTLSLGSGEANVAYAGTLQATGGTPGYTWTIKSGSLPPGLALNPSTGAISGTPSASGTYAFTVQVADSASPPQVQSASASITINPSTLTISSGALSAGQSGVAYTSSFQASGGTPAYTWALKSGTLPAGLSLSSAGVLSGTPSASGSFSFTVQVTDSSNPAQTQTASAALTINAPGLAISTTSLASAQAAAAYTATLQATGGTPGYTWAIKSGTLPAGLTLSPAGVLSGTPSTTGSVTFVVQVTDSASPAQVQSTTLTLAVNASTLAMGTVTLPSAQQGASYSGSFQAVSGTPAYTWSVKSGSLPAGLTLSATGAVSGTPSAVGTFNFVVQVTDSASPAQTQSASESITVGASSLAITAASLSAGQNGTAYTGTLLATGGTPSYSWTVKSGTLPAGVTLSATGVLSGTPTASGTSTFTVQVADSASPAQTQTATLSITINAATLAISSSVLAAGQNGTAYIGTLQATGGTPAYTWSIKSGTLPAGLTLNALTGAISGTPTTTGSFTFTVQVTDTASPAQIQTAATSITINAATLAISSSTLAAGQNGTAYTGTLQATGGTPAYTWSIKSGTLPAGLTLNALTGAISGTPTSTGSFAFTVQVTDSASPAQAQIAATSITIKPAPLTIPATTLTSGQSGTAYSATLQATGGTPGYTWTLGSGSLPAGLTLSTAGVISGTPSTYGSSTFTAQVTDSGSPAQTQTASLTLNISPATLTISAAALASGQSGSSYSASLQATGGTPSYTWSISSGTLPTGLTLAASTGVISGTPTAAGSFPFTVQATDSGSPAQTQTASKTITLSPSTLSISSVSLAAGETGTSYRVTLLATGGTPAYTWSIKSGSLPSGMTLSAAGLLSGLPSSSGTFTFTVQVADNGSPVQTATLSSSLTIAAAPAPPVTPGNTWYVRPDGGTRYSTNMLTGQCDGLGDVAYPGSGVNQHCAFKDVRLLWQDGSRADGTAFPAYGWIGKGGDTYLIRGSIGTGNSYRIGWNNGSNAYDSVDELYWGLPGDPYDSGIPTPLSGTATQHTRILGENYAACSAASAKTQFHGGYGVWHLLDMEGVSYVDLQCLDLTDFSDCSLAGSATKTCNKNIGTLTDFASIGIEWSNTSTHDSLTNVHVHGLAGDGMNGPTGDGEVFSYLDLIGNASSGWNADAGTGTTGSGSLMVQNFNISWNGCAEEYPIKDALPYFQCADDASGGYGDGFGTATLFSNPGWQAHFDQGVVSYNTQDGLDALHLRGAGSSMTITRVLAYGNMGQQIKVGGQAGTAQNNVVVTNCNAMRGAIPGTPSGYNTNLSDFCRAADTGIVLEIGPGTMTRFDNNTVYSASATAFEIECDETNGPCDNTALMDFRNNIFVGFLNDSAHGYVNGGSNDYSNPIYDGTHLWPLTSPGSFFSNNLTFHAKSNWSCPALGETNAVCADPMLSDETWHLYGYNDVQPTAASPIYGKGITLSDVVTDFNGVTRADPPSIGAYEK